jgi:hypothetical protein
MGLMMTRSKTGIDRFILRWLALGSVLGIRLGILGDYGTC